MCKNCKNNELASAKLSSRWYYSATRNVDYRECVFCSQILEEKEHVHLLSKEWVYNKEINQDVKKCSVCGIVMETRPHLNGFGEEKMAFEDWCCNDYQETNVDTKEKYLANEETYMYYEQQSFPDLEEEDLSLTLKLDKMFRAS